ncbi:type II toxin-antitoxin system prevent-host-death family antitoxin [Accumulibacter sp.]|uniref:Type II toxin-antitoxin system prevent-host-death family antitoxin n=1 Tax=Candidatus Accumulibacter proximus TaxID=2954385 RepID=A0A935UHX3_9PROT|nr:type II toxin-antitoxin system prevent-host-death family antitoxin [Accumulibacter sp.]MBK7675938.1 type II toxin-antitoxin system prevent-host-death family antitoxin [Candidatus Accumulibacter proximus]MBL8373732.1 type II toxin-antitoxin system prevent-host-death family antitoxin [Accumulibacter sp.]
MSIAIRELKASLSRVLARARGGEIIEVTSHNKPIARIVGIPVHAEKGLPALIASGALSWSGGKPQPQAPLEMTAHGTPVSQIVLDERS